MPQIYHNPLLRETSYDTCFSIHEIRLPSVTMHNKRGVHVRRINSYLEFINLSPNTHYHARCFSIETIHLNITLGH
jgi:hypothetical protein